MKLKTIREPFAGDVHISRNTLGNVEVNVPHSIVMHSPTGFEVGYAGSGPADLALNILAAFMPPHVGERPAKGFRGATSQFAMSHHQKFKFDFLVNMSRDGGTLKHEDVLAWIAARTADES